MSPRSNKPRQAEISVIVGTNLKRIRNLSGISQEALGDKLGITFQQVQKYEKGTNRISAPVLIELSDIFSVEIIDFFAGCTPDKKLKSVKKSPIPDVTPKTLHLAEQLTSMRAGKARDGLYQLIEALAQDQ